MSTINLNYMTRAYSILKEQTEQNCQNAASGAFKEKLLVSAGSKVDTSDMFYQASKVKTKEEMTLEEYKTHIIEEINKMPINPSQMKDTMAINISDKGFEEMKKDPEYEKWVMDGIRSSFAYYDPFGSITDGKFSVHNFGSTKEEYNGQCFYKAYNNGTGESLFNEKSKDSVWKKRVKRQEEQEELNEKLYLKRKVNMKYFQNPGQGIGIAELLLSGLAAGDSNT